MSRGEIEHSRVAKTLVPRTPTHPRAALKDFIGWLLTQGLRFGFLDAKLYHRAIEIAVVGSNGTNTASIRARCIQVFDSWVGALGPDDYVRFVQPYSRALIERIRATGVPVIHFGTGASGFFRELHAAGGDVMGVDWRVNIDQAWTDISYRSAVARQPGPGGPVRAVAGTEDEDRRAAEAHRHAARTHFQRGPWHSAGNPCGECESLRGDGARFQAMSQSC
jgi:hypothetical protein